MHTGGLVRPDQRFLTPATRICPIQPGRGDRHQKKAHLRGEPKGAEDLLQIVYKPQLLPILNQEVSERYTVSPSPPATITYTGLPLDEIEDALANARGILVPKQQK